MRDRNSSIELLRIISITLIVLMHSMGMVKNPMSDINTAIGMLIGTVGNTGVTIFILISGYFGIKYKTHRFVQLFLITTTYTIIVTTINSHGALGIHTLKAALVVPLYGNWFIACYLITMLLSPFVNEFTDNLEKRHFTTLLIIGFVMLNLIPTIFNSAYDNAVLIVGGKNLTYFIYVYLIGRFIKLHKDICLAHSKLMVAFLFSTTIIFMSNMTLYMIFHRRVGSISADCSPFILLSSISIFYFFKGFKYNSKIINTISSSVIAMYLCDGIRVYLDSYIRLSSKSYEPALIIYLMAMTISVFALSLIIDKVRIMLFGNFETYICDSISSKIEAVFYKFRDRL